MKALDQPFTKIINGAMQFVIPVFQRDYSWTEAECDQLWQDILAVANHPYDWGHFIGSVVYVSTGDGSAAFTRWLLIDGQQRITTLTLLLAALRDHIRKTGWKGDEQAPTAKRIEAYFLKNIQEEAIQQAEQAELKKLAAKRDVATVPIHGPGFFLEVLPRKYRLALLLPLDFTEVDDPSGIAEDATERKFLFYAKYDGGVSIRIKTPEDVEHALPIIRQAHALAKETQTLWPRPTAGDCLPPVNKLSKKMSLAERGQRNFEYWTGFVALAQQQSALPKLPNASRRPVAGCPIGRSGFRLVAIANLQKRYVGVALACRGAKGVENFRLLHDARAEIEAAIGESLTWQELVTGSSSHIGLPLPDADPNNEADWRRQHEWLLERMKRFHAVFGKRCKMLGRDEADLETRQSRRYRFWESLLQRAGERTALHLSNSPNRGGWVSAGAGRSGLSYSYVVGQHAGRLELYIDRGRGRKSENKQIFDSFHEHQSDLESTFGDALSWERLDARWGCRIAYAISSGGYRSDEQQWPAIHDAMIDAMIRLERAFAPRIADLKAD